MLQSLFVFSSPFFLLVSAGEKECKIKNPKSINGKYIAIGVSVYQVNVTGCALNILVRKYLTTLTHTHTYGNGAHRSHCHENCAVECHCSH